MPTKMPSGAAVKISESNLALQWKGPPHDCVTNSARRLLSASFAASSARDTRKSKGKSAKPRYAAVYSTISARPLAGPPCCTSAHSVMMRSPAHSQRVMPNPEPIISATMSLSETVRGGKYNWVNSTLTASTMQNPSTVMPAATAREREAAPNEPVAKNPSGM